MKQQSLWETFMQTGQIIDYLRYRQANQQQKQKNIRQEEKQ